MPRRAKEWWLVLFIAGAVAVVWAASGLGEDGDHAGEILAVEMSPSPTRASVPAVDGSAVNPTPPAPRPLPATPTVVTPDDASAAAIPTSVADLASCKRSCSHRFAEDRSGADLVRCLEKCGATP